MSLNVKMEQGEGLKRKLTIEVPADKVTSEMEKRFAEVRKSVTLKGFRKGKAPIETIRSTYGDEVRGNVIESLIRSSYPEAVRESTLKVASYPTVSDIELPEGGSLTFIATVEVLPEIESVRLDGLKITAMDTDVRDEDVDTFVEYLRKRHSELRKVDREARDGDLVVVDLDKVYDPKMVLQDKKFVDSTIDLGSSMTIKEFKSELPGMKEGDEKEIEVVYDDNYPDKTFAGAQIKYLCKVKAVKERIMPELNDAFAKMTGAAETALELKLKVRKDIELEQAQQHLRQQRSALIEQVCRQNEIPVPLGLVDEYLNRVVEDIKKDDPDCDEDEMRAKYSQVGMKTIRWNFLMSRLAELEKIEVSQQDTEQHIKRFADNYNMTVDQAREALARTNKIADVRESILEDKVLDFLVSRAEVSAAKV
ncbi:MAG: trigger factor [Candidatus Zixiibacteriota bacterium]